jgi:hypothetical protein
MTLRNVNKWRIQRAPQYGWKWCVFAPGYAIGAAFVGNSFQHCVNALPYLLRIDANARRLRRGQ